MALNNRTTALLAALTLSLGVGLGGSALAELALTAPAAQARAQIGQAAPDFTLKDLDGKTVKLSDYKGKVVVLEWFNPECPFVKAAYAGPLKDMAARETARGVVWLSINSGGAGKQGAGAETNLAARTSWNIKTPVLLDESGAVGKMYEAKTTPHMYVIDAQGVLRYRGALDNAPRGELEAGATPTNYVSQALDAVLGGKAVGTAETKPYGCSVKYASP